MDIERHTDRALARGLDTGLETKAGLAGGALPHEALVTHGELMRAFEDFKATNDERLVQEGKGAPE